MPAWSCPDSWLASSDRSARTPSPRSTKKRAIPSMRASISAYVIRRSRQTSTSWSGTAPATAPNTVARLKPSGPGPDIATTLARTRSCPADASRFSRGAEPLLEDGEVALGEAPVLPLLVEDGAQAAAYGLALGRRVGRPGHGLGRRGEPLVGE